MIYSCCDDRRRSILAAQSIWNGIDYIDVSDDQLTLRVFFILPLKPGQLTVSNIVITGGERITNVSRRRRFRTIGFVSPQGDPRVLVVTVNEPGDFTTYTLSLVDSVDPTKPPAGIRLRAFRPSIFRSRCLPGHARLSARTKLPAGRANARSTFPISRRISPASSA